MKEKTSIYGLNIRSFCGVCNKEVYVGNIYHPQVPMDNGYEIMDKFRKASVKHNADNECKDRK